MPTEKDIESEAFCPTKPWEDHHLEATDTTWSTMLKSGELVLCDWVPQAHLYLMQYGGYPTIPHPWETRDLVPEGTEGEMLRWEDKAKWKDTGLKINISDCKISRLWSLPLIPEPLGKKSLRVFLLEKLTPKKISTSIQNWDSPCMRMYCSVLPMLKNHQSTTSCPYTEVPVHC